MIAMTSRAAPPSTTQMWNFTASMFLSAPLAYRSQRHPGEGAAGADGEELFLVEGPAVAVAGGRAWP